MKKVLRIFQLCLLFLCFLGCSNSTDSSQLSESPTTEAMTTNDLFYDFSIPERYTLEQTSENTVVIMQGDLIVGGVILTDLDPACLVDTERTDIQEYLHTLAVSPLSEEYINMYDGGRVHITLVLTNTETSERWEQSHILYEYNSACYDYWYDQNILSAEEGATLGKNIVM